MIGSKHQSEGTRKQQILLAADLVLIEVGIEKFTIDQVIQKASISKGTVYRYFKNKDQILATLRIKAISLLHQKFMEETSKVNSQIDKIKAICVANFQYYKELPEYYKLISFTERPEFDIQIDQYVKIGAIITQFVEDIISIGQQKGEIKPDLDVSTVGYIIWACCVGVVQFVEAKQELIKTLPSQKELDFIQEFSEIITNGIKI